MKEKEEKKKDDDDEEMKENNFIIEGIEVKGTEEEEKNMERKCRTDGE
jgi:hypothetical protein